MKTKTWLALLAALAVIAVAVVVVGFGGDDENTTGASGNTTDAAFIADMTPHHQGAIVMARALLNKGEQPALRKMANDIISAQTEEIAQMKQWRKTWYGSAKVPTDVSGHGSMDDMDMGS